MTSYSEIIKNPSSPIKLVCVNTHEGVYEMPDGRKIPYSYTEGEVRERRKIILFPKNWKIFNSKEKLYQIDFAEFGGKIFHTERIRAVDEDVAERLAIRSAQNKNIEVFEAHVTIKEIK